MYTIITASPQRPFQLTPDARFWFDSRTHKKAMAYLGYGLAQSEGFIVITGEIGAGKSTLVAHLLATIDRERLNAVQLVSTQVEADDMLRLVAQGLGIGAAGARRRGCSTRSSGASTRKPAAAGAPCSSSTRRRTCRSAALEELRMLSNFTSGGRAAGPDLPARPARVPRPHRRPSRASSNCASESSPPTISSRWRRTRSSPISSTAWPSPAGRARPAFTADAFAALYRHSGGVPRRLNQLASRLLLQGAVERRRASAAMTVERWPPTSPPMRRSPRRRPAPPRRNRSAGRAEPAARLRARAADRGAGGAGRRAGGDRPPRLDPARRMGRERPAGAGLHERRLGGRKGRHAERAFVRRRGLVPGRRLRDRHPETTGTICPSASSAMPTRVLALFDEAGVKGPSSPWAGSPSAIRR